MLLLRPRFSLTHETLKLVNPAQLREREGGNDGSDGGDAAAGPQIKSATPEPLPCPVESDAERRKLV